MIVKPWCFAFVHRTEVGLTVHVTRIEPAYQVWPPPSVTGFPPTKESWLSRASAGRPIAFRKTKPGSPTPLPFGAGTAFALHRS